MYPLGRQFEVDYTRSKSDDKTFVKGNNFRITVITERVVRCGAYKSSDVLLLRSYKSQEG